MLPSGVSEGNVMSDFTDARGYDLLMGRWSRLLGEAFVQFAGIMDGECVLDVGCGTGSVSSCILSASPTAEVIGIDPSAIFVEAARDRIRDPRARFETGDAQAIGFPDGTFDCTVAMLVLNFVPVPARAVAEFRRVTRPGGRVSACVWDYGGEMTMLREFWDAAVALDSMAAPHHEARMPLCRSGELAELWRAAGLAEVHEGALTLAMRFAHFADFWQPFLTGIGPSGGYAAALPEDMRRRLEVNLCTELWNDRPEQALTLPARAWAVIGTVPDTS